jgi:putative transposase
MPRRIRLDGPAVAHHVWIHALGDGALFFCVDDYQDFVDRLCRLCLECGARCFAWVLMGNHVHLVIQTSTGALSRLMQRLNTGFAIRFNRRSGRRGYVLMDRFQSRIVEGDADLINLVRYVHCNPLAAGIVGSLDSLAAYPWAGHGALVGRRDALAFEAVAQTLSLFDDDPARARAELLSWMARSDLPDPTAPATRPAAAPTALPLPPPSCAPRGDLETLLRAACASYGIEPHALRSGSMQPRIARARSVVAYVAVIQLGESGATVAGALGISRAAVSGALARGQRAAAEDGFWQSGKGPLRGESEPSEQSEVRPRFSLSGSSAPSPSARERGSGGGGKWRS